MTQNHDNNRPEVDLQLAESLIELTKIVEKNSSLIEKLKEEIKEENPVILKWNKKLEEWEIALENKFDQIFQKIESLSSRIEDNMNHFTSLVQQTEKHENQLINISEELEGVKNLVPSQERTIEEIKSELDKKVAQDHFKTALNDAIEEVTEKSNLLKQTQVNIQSEIHKNEEETKIRFNTIADTIEMINTGLEELDLRNKAQSTYLEEQREVIFQLKQGLKEIISQVKEDQQLHFENFSRIIESLNENIHTEITLMTQSLKESDINILNEVSTHYMRKKVGKELQGKITDIATELEVEAKKTREELIKSLEKTVSEYESIMEQQTSSIKNYKQELVKFQDEILAVIDRKVNEKYEVIFSLLSSVAAHAEELALFVKTTEIQIPRSLAEIKKNTKSSEVEEIKQSNIQTDSEKELFIDDKEE